MKQLPSKETFYVDGSIRSVNLGVITIPGNPYVYTVYAMNGSETSSGISTGFYVGSSDSTESFYVFDYIDE
ncbi:MAG: hypothetical protein LUD02_02150 [Tannerellaceae bacterium]|nr:hypothetical protein [Tannerellaceae bacterium]